MARISRIVVPGVPHHITQRGNRRQQTFFHVHLVAMPLDESGLRLAIGEAHRRYTRAINFQHRWRGHLWQGRFASFPMDRRYLLAAVRYIELNPVRAKMVKKAADYPYSSAAAHMAGMNDQLSNVSPLLEMVGDWKSFLSVDHDEKQNNELRLHETTGRPLGSSDFIIRLEEQTGRILQRQKPGPKRESKDN